VRKKEGGGGLSGAPAGEKEKGNFPRFFPICRRKKGKKQGHPETSITFARISGGAWGEKGEGGCEKKKKKKKKALCIFPFLKKRGGLRRGKKKKTLVGKRETHMTSGGKGKKTRS